MQNLDWFRTYTVLQQLKGYKVKVDGTYNGVITDILGGPLEIFFMVDIGSEILFINATDPNRIDLQE